VTPVANPDQAFVAGVDLQHRPKPVPDVAKQALPLFVSITVVAATRASLHQAAAFGDARFAG
jgi:hypothetical protein